VRLYDPFLEMILVTRGADDHADNAPEGNRHRGMFM